MLHGEMLAERVAPQSLIAPPANRRSLHRVPDHPRQTLSSARVLGFRLEQGHQRRAASGHPDSSGARFPQLARYRFKLGKLTEDDRLEVVGAEPARGHRRTLLTQ